MQKSVCYPKLVFVIPKNIQRSRKYIANASWPLSAFKVFFGSKRAWLICVCILAMGFQGQNVKTSTNGPPVVGELHHEWEMETEGKGVKLDISHVERKGKLDPDDEAKILALVSRVKRIDPKIVNITALGDTFYTPAVAVIDIWNTRVYLVQLKNGRWDVSHVKFARF